MGISLELFDKWVKENPDRIRIKVMHTGMFEITRIDYSLEYRHPFIGNLVVEGGYIMGIPVEHFNGNIPERGSYIRDEILKYLPPDEAVSKYTGYDNSGLFKKWINNA